MRTLLSKVGVILGAAWLASVSPAWAQETGLPATLRGVGIDQKLNQQLPLDLAFTDENGLTKPLGEFFRGRPVVLVFAYYECPMLCTLVLNALTKSLNVLKFDAGREFDIVTVSIDPTETATLAAKKKATHLASYKRATAAEGWHFLTGSEANIKALTAAAGFRYEYDQKGQQYAHASAIMVVTPKGKMAKYLYGLEYSPTVLRLSLVEAADEKIGTVVDVIMLYCFHYDPSLGAYTLTVLNVLRLLGAITITTLVGFIAISLVRDRKKKRGQPNGPTIGGSPKPA